MKNEYNANRAMATTLPPSERRTGAERRQTRFAAERAEREEIRRGWLKFLVGAAVVMMLTACALAYAIEVVK